VARSYRDLLVWQKAKTLSVEIYRATEQFPRTETYGLTSQIRRAAVSVASNIAEGQGRLSRTGQRIFAGTGYATWYCTGSELPNRGCTPKNGPRSLPGSRTPKSPYRIFA